MNSKSILLLVVINSLIYIFSSTVLADKPVTQKDHFIVTKLPDSSIYTGSIKNDMFHGLGRLEWRNGNVYEGDFFKGLMEGYGVYTLSNGDVYKGTFKDGLYHGEGRLEGRNGYMYKGGFRDSWYHGTGIEQLSNGDRYEGQFKQGMYDGKGVYKSARNTISGNFSMGEPIDEIRIVWTNGNIYIGTVKSWEMHGRGKLEDQKMGTYIGEFNNGQFHGEGDINSFHGYRYQGHFQSKRPNQGVIPLL